MDTSDMSDWFCPPSTSVISSALSGFSRKFAKNARTSCSPRQSDGPSYVRCAAQDWITYDGHKLRSGSTNAAEKLEYATIAMRSTEW